MQLTNELTCAAKTFSGTALPNAAVSFSEPVYNIIYVQTMHYLNIFVESSVFDKPSYPKR